MRYSISVHYYYFLFTYSCRFLQALHSFPSPKTMDCHEEKGQSQDPTNVASREKDNHTWWDAPWSPSFSLIGYGHHLQSSYWTPGPSEFIGNYGVEGYGLTNPTLPPVSFGRRMLQSTSSLPVDFGPVPEATALQAPDSVGPLTLNTTTPLVPDTKQADRYDNLTQIPVATTKVTSTQTAIHSQALTSGNLSLKRKQLGRASRKTRPRLQGPMDGSLQCKHCSKSFTRKPDLERHNQSMHQKGIELYCPILTCKKSRKGQGFKRKDNRDKHYQRMHTFVPDESDDSVVVRGLWDSQDEFTIGG